MKTAIMILLLLLFAAFTTQAIALGRRNIDVQ